jgi:uncharacterized membrane protein
MRYIAGFFVTLLTFIVIDGVWLGLVARTFYKNQIGELMAAQPNWTAAIIFYLLFIVGLLYFVVYPNSDKGTTTLLISGALFGLITYATYDLTNLATLKDWPVTVTLVDMLWGTTLSASVALVATTLLKRFSLL